MPSRLKMGPLISELQEWHRLAYVAAPTKAALLSPGDPGTPAGQLGRQSECWEAEGPRASRTQAQ